MVKLLRGRRAVCEEVRKIEGPSIFLASLQIAPHPLSFFDTHPRWLPVLQSARSRRSYGKIGDCEQSTKTALHNESNDFHCTKRRDCTQLIEKKHSIVCYLPSLLFSFPIICKPGFLFSFLRANQNSEFRRRRTIGLSVFTVPCYPHKI